MTGVTRLELEGDGVPTSIRPGDTLAGRYRLDDLLSESGSGRFWRARDGVLHRHVALHIMASGDERSDALRDAARRSATVIDPRILRVLDAQLRSDVCFVVNEWGEGTSLDIALASNGPIAPRRAAWLVAEVADSIAVAHTHGVHHGRLVPENVLIDAAGQVRIIGLAVDAALHGLSAGDEAGDVRDLAGLLYAALTGRWAGDSSSSVPPAPHEAGRVLRPRQVRAGVPRPLDDLVDELLHPDTARARGHREPRGADAVAAYLRDFVGDPSGIAESLAGANPCRAPDQVVLEQVPDSAVRPPPPLPDTPVAVSAAALPVEQAAPPEDPGPAVAVARARPLFAEDDDTTGRRSRLAAAQRDDRPWDRDPGADPRLAADEEDPVDEVPGRRWLRLAGIVAVVAVVVLVLAVLLTHDGDGGQGDGAVATEPVVTGPVLPDVAVRVFDPSGRPGVAADDVDAAVDGDPATSWSTGTYTEQFSAGGTRAGIGLLIDTGTPQPLTQVDLSLDGSPTSVVVYVLSQVPQSISTLRPALSLDATEQTSLSLRPGTTGRYVVVWLTSIPQVGDTYAGGIAEVAVHR